MPQLYANLSKNSTVPSVAGGILWADNVNKVFYLFGGEYTQGPPLGGSSLWGYDVILNQWNLTSSSSNKQIDRVAYGAGVSVSERAEAYYFGGYLSNKTIPGWSGPPLATSNIVKYDMARDSWSNNTGPDSIPRAEGVMVFIPASDQGLLIYFGGVTSPFGNETVLSAPMETIYIYDIASSKWYTQTATGTVPERRRRFCAGATWAQDKSSYNIYLYGGLGFPPNTTAYDDVYILTLPSFRWIKWYPTEPGPGAPHHSLTCNVINGAQMLIIGGTFPATDACDSPGVWGTHNLNLGKNNPDNAKWSMFYPDLKQYNVPSEIVAVVGGSASGGATKAAPDLGWNNRDLPIYFTRQATFTARTPTRYIPTSTSSPTPTATPSPAPKERSKTPVIAGAAVGGTIGLVATVTLLFCCLKRYRENRPERREPAELANNQPFYHVEQVDPESPEMKYHYPQSPAGEYYGVSSLNTAHSPNSQNLPNSPSPIHSSPHPALAHPTPFAPTEMA
ncbi:hypothetical protein GP486_006013 [Trichoglossum hirsutum]|uniref:Kelch repeat protein n=1 Tax=Trichoglossum hirsutum TaxID=265104 RepID=A0A9P8L859_9PEZI|nr:hypothetical protein GP486_006013 [Trichoglossum hirsutum]